MHAIFRLGKARVSPLAVTLLVSFFQVGVCAASPASPVAQKAEQSSVKKARAKQAVKAHKKVVKKADPQPAAAMGAAISAAAPIPAGLALKPSQSVSVETAQPAPAQAPVNAYVPRVNPYLVNQQPSVPAPVLAANTENASAGHASASSGFRFSLPRIAPFEQSILPKIQTVYPTGEKPLVVMTFKCPTELVGIDTPSTLILHKVVNGGMDLINRTDLLSFNLQQVCQ